MLKKREKLAKINILYALLIATAIFMIGLLVGIYSEKDDYHILSDMQSYQILGYEGQVYIQNSGVYDGQTMIPLYDHTGKHMTENEYIANYLEKK